jgi:MoaA/NifB/PqqE/SkfB family radical SAM enzyme
LRNIKVLHVESTDVCQAACPACARETDPSFNKNKKHHLTVEHIQQKFTEQTIAGLDKMFMCGNYGDPAAGYYTIDIYSYFRKINPDIVLGMNTNGGLQSTFFWHALGKLFCKPQDYCVFSIDGLEDTNSVYRKNVNWSKVMANAEAFIAAGGSAHWEMLVFKHNQHQVEQCQQLARDMGFKWFNTKVSKRQLNNGLELPMNWHEPVRQSGAIQCHALAEQSMYIDAHGRVSPCCWLGAKQKDLVTDDLDTVSATWTTETPHPTCVRACSSKSDRTNFGGQWRQKIELSQ